MRIRSPLPCLAVVAALAFAGCGDDNPRLIPQDDADKLTATVDEIGSLVADGDCAAARDAVDRAREQLAELPRRVDNRLERNIGEWLEHVDQRIPQDCEEKAAETPTPSPTETPTETPTPSPTETPTETPTPEPTETPTPEPTEVPTVEPEGGTGVPEGDGG